MQVSVTRFRWRRWATGTFVALAALVLITMTVLAWSSGDRTTLRVAEQPGSQVVQRWWASAHGDVEALTLSISDVQHGLAVDDPAAVGAACQQMHDAAAMRLAARLPAPVPELTADLSGAIEDAHAAAHLCLAAEAGSSADHAGEFHADLEQSQRQLLAAQVQVNRLLSHA